MSLKIFKYFTNFVIKSGTKLQKKTKSEKSETEKFKQVYIIEDTSKMNFEEQLWLTAAAFE